MAFHVTTVLYSSDNRKRKLTMKPSQNNNKKREKKEKEKKTIQTHSLAGRLQAVHII